MKHTNPSKKMADRRKLRRRTGGSALPVVDIDAMSDEEKELLYRQALRIKPGQGRPLTAADRKLHVEARLRGRQKVGRGVRVISLSLERGLLERADATARRRSMTRAALISRALEAELSKAG